MPTRLSQEQMPIGFPVKRGLPPGLSLTPEGQLTGIPIEAGIWVFDVQVTDQEGRTATKRLTIAVQER